MKTVFNLRKVDVAEKDTLLIEKKLTRLEKFFSSSAIATVTISKTRENTNVEVTVAEKGMFFRAERSGKSLTACVDEIIDILTRQIRKNKTRLEKRLYDGKPMAFDSEYIDQEEYNIVKSKTVYLKPMDKEEAILEMNMLGHSFFLYQDEDTHKVCLAYKRQDGDYGILEAEIQ